jgi:hypothetical protein
MTTFDDRRMVTSRSSILDRGFFKVNKGEQMKQITICGLILATVVGCGSAGESEPGIDGSASATDVSATAGEPTSVTKQELNPAGFSWSLIPGAPSIFYGPSIWSQYNAPNNRQWLVCGTSSNDRQIYCNYRYILGGTDTGWNGWIRQDGPAGVQFQSTPVYQTFVDTRTNTTLGALAARGTPSPAACGTGACVFINISQHAGGSTWYAVPGSANVGGGDISLVSSGDYLYLFATSGSNQAVYTRNKVASGYENAKWDPWSYLPGGGIFHKNVRASALSGGGIVLAGVGTDDSSWFQEFNGSSWEGFYRSMGGIFKDSINPVSFDYGNNITLFGLGTTNAAYEATGDLAAGTIDGWWQITSPTLLNSPAAFSPAPGVVDVAVRGNTWDIYFSTWPN